MQSLRRTLTDSGFEGVTSYYLDDISVSWADTATVSITRGDAVKMLFDHAHRWDEAVGPPTFTDVAWDAPYAEAVAWAEQNGYLGGYGNGFFGPEDMMSVEQAMVMIYRLFGSPKVTDAGVLDSYKDASQISPWARCIFHYQQAAGAGRENPAPVTHQRESPALCHWANRHGRLNAQSLYVYILKFCTVVLYESGIPLRFCRKGMPVCLKVIQLVCQFPCQLESAKETVHRAFLCNEVLCVHDPQHQLSLWLFQSLNELLVASFNFLLRLCHRQWRVKSVVEFFSGRCSYALPPCSKTTYHKLA